MYDTDPLSRTEQTCKNRQETKKTDLGLVECVCRTCADVDGTQHGDTPWIHVDRGQCISD